MLDNGLQYGICRKQQFSRGGGALLNLHNLDYSSVGSVDGCICGSILTLLRTTTLEYSRLFEGETIAYDIHKRGQSHRSCSLCLATEGRKCLALRSRKSKWAWKMACCLCIVSRHKQRSAGILKNIGGTHASRFLFLHDQIWLCLFFVPLVHLGYFMGFVAGGYTTAGTMMLIILWPAPLLAWLGVGGHWRAG